MDYQQAIDRLSPDVIARLRQAVETGRWPDGQALSAEQRKHSMQAVIAWEARHIPEAERVGFIDRGRKAADSCADDAAPLRWEDGPAGASR